MSKVSHKSELLPSFEPIEHKPTSQQKRKRSNAGTTAALKEALSNGDGQPVTKKPKAKKNSASSVAIAKSVVWIGATVMQQQEEESENVDSASEISAAYSIYYGLNDSRNCTEKITIKKDQNLDHVYSLGVMHALENCEDDSSNLLIHTGSKLLQKAIDDSAKNSSENDICNQLKEKIAKRKGSTSIHYKAQLPNKEDESQVAHLLAKEKLSEDKMMVDDGETLVDSLEVTETKVAVTTTTEVTTIITDQDDKEVEKTVVTSIKEEVNTSTSPAEPVPTNTNTTPSWASTLSLRNLLEVLKAPFYRNNKQQ